MTTTAYPHLFALLAQPPAGGYERPYSAQRLADLETALTQFQAAEQQGEIANVRYKEARETVSRAMEQAWSNLPKPKHDALRGLPQGEALMDSFYGSWLTLVNAEGKLKKIQKLSHPDLASRQALLEELLPLVRQVNGLKSKVVKRAVKTEEERAAEEAQRFQVPRSSSEAVERVRTLLEQVVDPQFEALVQRFDSQLHAQAQHFLDQQAAAQKDPTLKGTDWNGKPRPDYTLRQHATYRAQGRDVVDGPLLVFLETVLVATSKVEGRRHWAMSPQVDALIAPMARKEATDVRDRFIYKNLSKLAGILERKGDDQFQSAEVVANQLSLTALDSRLRFSFRDGSSFETTTSVVFVINEYGTRFNRFPLTFHNVQLDPKTPMPSPSEERMYTTFLGMAAPKAAEPAAPKASTRRRYR